MHGGISVSRHKRIDADKHLLFFALTACFRVQSVNLAYAVDDKISNVCADAFTYFSFRLCIAVENDMLGIDTRSEQQMKFSAGYCIKPHTHFVHKTGCCFCCKCFACISHCTIAIGCDGINHFFAKIFNMVTIHNVKRCAILSCKGRCFKVANIQFSVCNKQSSS